MPREGYRSVTPLLMPESCMPFPTDVFTVCHFWPVGGRPLRVGGGLGVFLFFFTASDSCIGFRFGKATRCHGVYYRQPLVLVLVLVLIFVFRFF